jgi:hypothetical protein
MTLQSYSSVQQLAIKTNAITQIITRKIYLQDDSSSAHHHIVAVGLMSEA